MTLKLHNTLTNSLDEFTPINQKKVLMYSCGPTVYDYPHIGNWTSYIYWDTLVRLLTYTEYDVERAINITDVGHLVSDGDTGEDKLEKGAKREGKTAWEVAKFYTDVFIDGFDKLNLIRPKFMPAATDFVPQQIDLIRRLKEKGVVYQISDGLYFDTAKFPQYADFAKLDLENLMAGARIHYNTEKRNVSDFALWKFCPLNEKRDMEWETPNDLLDNPSDVTLMGFPGWHIECSAIVMSLFGETIDIHTGGIDAIPVHHTNEIAQSQTATGKTFSNYWVHCNFLKVDGNKMSKSIGNIYTINNLIERGYSPMDFRMFVLQGNYRNEGNFTFENLDAAKNRLHNWRNIAAIRHQIHDTIISNNEKNDSKHTLAFYALTGAIVQALNDNLNTPEALKLIDEAFSNISKTKPENINKESLIETLEAIDSLLGLKILESTPDISDDNKALIIERSNVRSQKDWQKSDELRDKLAKNGIKIRDINQDDCIWEYSDQL
jgi:cysteinyl-tRNA synthetase